MCFHYNLGLIQRKNGSSAFQKYKKYLLLLLLEYWDKGKLLEFCGVFFVVVCFLLFGFVWSLVFGGGFFVCFVLFCGGFFVCLFEILKDLFIILDLYFENITS